MLTGLADVVLAGQGEGTGGGAGLRADFEHLLVEAGHRWVVRVQTRGETCVECEVAGSDHDGFNAVNRADLRRPSHRVDGLDLRDTTRRDPQSADRTDRPCSERLVS